MRKHTYVECTRTGTYKSKDDYLALHAYSIGADHLSTELIDSKGDAFGLWQWILRKR
jgi:hypothetical protein